MNHIVSIKIDDPWVCRRLIGESPSEKKRRIPFFGLNRRVPLGAGKEETMQIGFAGPLLPISMSDSIVSLSIFIKRKIDERPQFLSYSKILESKGLTSVSKYLAATIERLPDYQALAYMTGAWYRDHIAHQVRVAALGDFMLTQQFDFQGRKGELIDTISTLGKVTKEEVRKAWWISGLFHDVGLPLSLVDKWFGTITRDISNAYKYLPMTQKGIPHPKINEGELRTVFGFLINGLSRQDVSTMKENMGWNSSISPDHGLLSAMTLLFSIPDISKNAHDQSQLKDLFEGEYSAALLAARAMALHNMHGQKKTIEIDFEKHPLTYLLVLCDEMQEWGREVKVTNRSKQGFVDSQFGSVSLVESITLDLYADRIQATAEFKNQEAKDACGFVFDIFQSDKKENLGRLKDHRRIFPHTCLTLKDHVMSRRTIISTVSETISIQ